MPKSLTNDEADRKGHEGGAGGKAHGPQELVIPRHRFSVEQSWLNIMNAFAGVHLAVATIHSDGMRYASRQTHPKRLQSPPSDEAQRS